MRDTPRVMALPSPAIHSSGRAPAASQSPRRAGRASRFPADRMTGAVKTFLPEKGYGFIRGDDGKDYFFHLSQVRNQPADRVCEEALVTFVQKATPKGYRAERIDLVNPDAVTRYIVPDRVLISKDSEVRGWEILERTTWYAHGKSSDSPDAAKAAMIAWARDVGAKGVTDVSYYKTVGKEGAYRFSVHHYSGRVVILGKRSLRGTYQLSDLLCKVDNNASLLVALERLPEWNIGPPSFVDRIVNRIASWFVW